jgi:hypothetical protein
LLNQSLGELEGTALGLTTLAMARRRPRHVRSYIEVRIFV